MLTVSSRSMEYWFRFLTGTGPRYAAGYLVIWLILDMMTMRMLEKRMMITKLMMLVQLLNIERMILLLTTSALHAWIMFTVCRDEIWRKLALQKNEICKTCNLCFVIELKSKSCLSDISNYNFRLYGQGTALMMQFSQSNTPCNVVQNDQSARSDDWKMLSSWDCVVLGHAITPELVIIRVWLQ